MALKLYLFGLILASLLSFFLWLLLFLGVNPVGAPFWIVFLFYATIFIFLTTVFAIANFYFKVWLGNREVIFSHLGPSLRQAGLISLILTSFLFFEQIKVLNWWVAGMVICAAGLIELFFRSKR